MTDIHEFTACHIPLRYHEAVYPGTLKRRQTWGLFFWARQAANGMKACAGRQSPSSIFFPVWKHAEARLGKVNRRDEGPTRQGQCRGDLLGWL